jgi:phosphate starvation-inducible PhoH-like protein/PhoH-like ATPase
MAGTGKTFISLYLALEEILSINSKYKKIVIVRSVVPTRDIGFLPGKESEKIEVYESPYRSICTELFDRGDAYGVLKHNHQIEFICTSFVRGITLNDSIIIVDEMNNMNFHELDSIMTRIGDNCKVVFAGDFRQSDLTNKSDKAGLKTFMNIIDRVSNFAHIEFDENDIVRSRLVKEYIIAREKVYTSSA